MHDKKEHLQLHKTIFTKDKMMVCPVCKKEFLWKKEAQRVHFNRPNKNAKGPFCSSKCALRYAANFRTKAPLKNPKDYGIA